jgi:hypothetical protein
MAAAFREERFSSDANTLASNDYMIQRSCFPPLISRSEKVAFQAR